MLWSAGTIIIILLLSEFFTLTLLMVFQWSGSESPQISGTLLITLADLNNAVI